jgi:uncharacterized protein (TIGR02996 family)
VTADALDQPARDRLDIVSLVDRLEPAMPEAVRAVIAEARAGRGIAAAWLARGEPGERVGECLALANRRDVDAPVFGWLVGVTMFDDEAQRLAEVLVRPSHRASALVHVIEAFAAGVAAGVVPGGRWWTSIERLARQCPALPASLARALPVGLSSAQATARGAALRLAVRLAIRGRDGGDIREAIAAARARARPTEARRLDVALAMLDGTAARPTSEDDLELLVRLLDAWRDTRDPALEGPIAHLGSVLGRARGSLGARSKSELESAWHALAVAGGDEVDISRLLDAPWPASWRAALDRVRVLARRPADPRIAARVAEIARRYPSADPAFNLAVRTLLVSSASPLLLSSLDALDGMNEALHPICEPVRVAIEARAHEPHGAQAELLAEVTERIDPGGHLAALWAEHLEHPADLGIRAVLADALQLAGEPRGEFIALQLALADPRTPAAERAVKQRRVDALLAEHGDRWAGPLPVYRPSCRFERGCLVAVRCDAQAAVVRRSIDRYEWRTIEQAVFSDPDCDLGPLVARMPLLRRVAAAGQALARLLEAGPVPRLRAVIAVDSWLPPRGAFPDLVITGLTHTTYYDDGLSIADATRTASELGVTAIVHFGLSLSHLTTVLACATTGPPETRVMNDLDADFDPLHTRVIAFRDTRRLVAFAPEHADVLQRIVRAAGWTFELADEPFDIAAPA